MTCVPDVRNILTLLRSQQCTLPQVHVYTHLIEIGMLRADSAAAGQQHTAGANMAQLLKRAVHTFGEQRNFHKRTRKDIQRELLIRSRAGLPQDEPSLRGTFTAATSWVLPKGESDLQQHRGGSSFMEPWFAQLPRTQDEIERDSVVGGGAVSGVGGGNSVAPWRMTRDWAPSLDAVSSGDHTGTDTGTHNGAGASGAGERQRGTTAGGSRRWPQVVNDASLSGEGGLGRFSSMGGGAVSRGGARVTDRDLQFDLDVDGQG